MKSINVKKARQIIQKAFQDDPDFRRVYVDNIACLIMDSVPNYQDDKPGRDALAGAILDLIFGKPSNE
jgi:hypothetical protein